MTAGGRRSARARRTAGETRRARRVAWSTTPAVPVPDPSPAGITVTTYGPDDEPGWVNEHHRASCRACGWEGTDWIGKEHAESQGADHERRDHA
jgi:hypothetical protein